jgi:hypothetical protein
MTQKKEFIQVEMLSDDDQIEILKVLLDIKREEAMKIIDRLYSKGCEIVKTGNARSIELPEDEEQLHAYNITKKFLESDMGIDAFRKQEGIPYPKFHSMVRSTILRLTDQKGFWLQNIKARREFYLKLFK